MTERTTGHFDGFDLEGLFSATAYSDRAYLEPAPSDDTITEIETELGHRLPDAYVELARIRNGGALVRSVFPTAQPNGWADDHVAAEGIAAIGRTSTYSLCGDLGSAFMEQEWGYPHIGVYFADTPTAGHQMIGLDYRTCGPTGEPSVVWVDQEDDYAIVEIAPNFATFIRGLVREEDLDSFPTPTPIEELPGMLAPLSPALARAVAAVDIPDGEQIVRGLAADIVRNTGELVFDRDDSTWSLLMDVVFWLYTSSARIDAQREFRRALDLIFGPAAVTAGALGFTAIDDAALLAWWNRKVGLGTIVRGPHGHRYEGAQWLLMVARPSTGSRST